MTTPTKQAALAMPAGLTPAEKVLELIKVSDAALSKAAAADAEYARVKQATADLIPAVVDTMVEHDRIRPDQREKLAGMLENPVEVLRLLQKVSGHRNAEEAAKLGTGVSQSHTKEASAAPQAKYDSLSSPFAGGRTKSGSVKQSDLALFKGLGLPTPTGS